MVSPANVLAFERALGRALGGSPERALELALRRATQEHPGLVCDERALCAALARGCREGDPEAWLERVRAGDLLLAVCAELGQPAAVATLHRLIAPEAERATRRARVPVMDAPDLQQLVSERLLVSEPGARPKIAEYTGDGDLRGWIRVIAVRALIDAGRKRSGTEAPSRDEVATELLLGADPGPELSYLKQRYRTEFASAFTEAIEALDPEDRLLLRSQYVDRLTIDQVALAHGVHRATAARQMQRAREALLSDTRRRLMAKLNLSRGELESVMRLIESQLHVSVGRLLVS